MEPCIKEADISMLKTNQINLDQKLDHIISLLEGNGKTGLVENLQETKNDFNNFRWQVIIGFVLVTTGGTTSGYMFFEMLKKLMLR